MLEQYLISYYKLEIKRIKSLKLSKKNEEQILEYNRMIRELEGLNYE